MAYSFRGYPRQVQQIFIQVPYLIGQEAAEALSVISYLRTELGLVQRGELGSALMNCPAMLLYSVPENLDRKVMVALREGLPWRVACDRLLSVLPEPTRARVLFLFCFFRVSC